jgi:hypothetical protein
LQLLHCVIALLVMFMGWQASAQDYQDGVLLDAHDYDSCHGDCAPFDRPTLYFCVQVGSAIVVGSRGADPVWAYDSSKMFALRGSRVSVRTKGASLWIKRPDGKPMHVKQDYSMDVFSNRACSNTGHRHWLQKFEHVRRPATVPVEAVLVPTSFRSYFWVSCKFDAQKNWDACSEWDKQGSKYPHDRELVDAASHQPVMDSELDVDPVATSNDYEIHLRNGTVLKDWAKSRINNNPSPGSIPPQPPSR